MLLLLLLLLLCVAVAAVLVDVLSFCNGVLYVASGVRRSPRWKRRKKQEGREGRSREVERGKELDDMFCVLRRSLTTPACSPLLLALYAFGFLRWDAFSMR